MIKVTFVCLGNICRSPMAEAIFQDLVDKAGLSDQFLVDSAGTSSYHVGESAHPGTRRILSDHDIQYVGRSRQIKASELADTHYVIALDRHNLHDLRQIARDRELEDRMHLLLAFAKNVSVKDVPDPYYTGNFEAVYQMVRDGCEGLLAHIRQQEEI